MLLTFMFISSKIILFQASIMYSARRKRLEEIKLKSRKTFKKKKKVKVKTEPEEEEEEDASDDERVRETQKNTKIQR